MEFRKTLDSEQFRTQGVGPHEPVADNGTEEGRSQNRRVELVILRNDLDYTDPEVIKDILAQDYNLPIDQIDPNAPSQDQGKLPNDSAQGIIDSLESLFPSGGLQAASAVLSSTTSLKALLRRRKPRRWTLRLLMPTQRLTTQLRNKLQINRSKGGFRWLTS